MILYTVVYRVSKNAVSGCTAILTTPLSLARGLLLYTMSLFNKILSTTIDHSFIVLLEKFY